MRVFIFVALAVLLLSCGESPEKYNSRLFVAADSIMSFTENNITVSSMCQRAWRSVIYDSKYINPLTEETTYMSDFNNAIVQFKKDISGVKEIYDKRKVYVDSVYSTLKEVPDKSKENFDILKKIMQLHDKTYNTAFSPEGSLQEYTNLINDYDKEWKEIKSELDLLKK